MRVTVLVAAYNAAIYLPRCLDSLLAQTYKDVEIIVADDASTDSTQQLLSTRYPQVRVVTLPQNMGQAVARNRALQVATGDLVTMVDADDWLDNDAIQRAVEMMVADTDVDAVLFRLQLVYDDTSKIEEYACATNTTITGKEAFTLSLTWQLHGLYVARRQLYNLIQFDTATRLYSDDNTTRLHYLHSRKVAFCQGVYNYYIHSHSCTNKVGFSRFYMQAALRSLSRALVRFNVDDADRRLFEGYRWRMFVDGAYTLYTYKECLTDKERHRAARLLAATYETFKLSRIPCKNRIAFGFIYMPCWWLMRAQWGIYFPLQALKKKYFH